MRTRRFFSRAMPVALVAATIAFGAVVAFTQSRERFVDLRAFYCAGHALLAGADPYREHPLHECEAHLAAFASAPLGAGHATIPAPFPGFVLALFALVARLPFAVAVVGWTSAAAAALAVSVVLAARTTRTPVVAGAIAIGFPGAMLALPIGQITPFVLLAVVGTAALLEAGRPRWAALAALGALFDPHVGLALVLGVFAGVRLARATLAAGTGALVAVGLAVAGPAREWEYVSLVVPAHALANVADATQFSLTTLAFEAGVPPAAAVGLGGAWYLAALGLGVGVALRLRASLGIAAAALVPPAFAAFGGTYTHLQQLAVALPAFLLLTSAAGGRRRDAAAGLTFAACVPWLYIVPYPLAYVVPCTLAACFARALGSGRQALRLAAASFAILVSGLVALLTLPAGRVVAPSEVSGNPLAQVSWQAFTDAWNVPLQPWYLVARIPTTIAFIGLLAMLVRMAFPTRRSPAVPLPDRVGPAAAAG